LESLDLAVCSYGLHQGNGVDLCAYEQASELVKQGHNVTVYTFSRSLPLIDGADTILVGGYKRFWTTSKLAPTVSKHDGVVSFGSPFFMMAPHLDNHIMVDFGTPPLQYSNGPKELVAFSMIKAMTLRAASKSKLVLPGSKYIARATNPVTNGNKMISHSGITFAPINGEKYDCGHPYILFVGRHVEYKQVDQLIRLFDNVRETVPDAMLLTVGNMSSRLKSKLCEQAKRVGNVRLLGYVDDVWSLYRGASVYANCSLWEGEDRPALEAQSVGVPVVTWNNTAHPEVVFNGECVNTEYDFEQALIYYLTHPGRDYMVADHVRDEFGVKSVVSKWVSRYKELA
jgi:glycosyltransferase involved in cell wall biosynthesis